MQIDLNKLEVIHNPGENRFETWIDGNLSKLDYIQDGKNFVITHVGVHPSLKGAGSRRADRGSQPGLCQREFTAGGSHVLLCRGLYPPAPGVCGADPAGPQRMSEDLVFRTAQPGGSSSPLSACWRMMTWEASGRIMRTRCPNLIPRHSSRSQADPNHQLIVAESRWEGDRHPAPDVPALDQFPGRPASPGRICARRQGM